MICPLVMCLVLCLVHGNTKPTEKKSRVREGEPLSELKHEDDKSYDFDHEAFLGGEEAKEFNELPPEESLRRLGIIVDKIDSDKDGFVSVEELRDFIKINQKKHIFESVDDQWSNFDTNKDNLISWLEYKNITYGMHLASNANDSITDLMMSKDERRFRVADINGDLMADKQEFTAFLHPEDHDHMIDTVVQDVMEDIDKDKDGFVSKTEFIGDIYTSGEGGEVEPEWVAVERQQFDEFKDKNKDGKLDRNEVRDWVIPDDNKHAEMEAKHLVDESDTNQDGKLTKSEILEKHEVFVGSQVTDYGQNLLQHDEF